MVRPDDGDGHGQGPWAVAAMRRLLAASTVMVATRASRESRPHEGIEGEVALAASTQCVSRDCESSVEAGQGARRFIDAAWFMNIGKM